MRAVKNLIITTAMFIACMPVFADSYDDPNNPKTPLQGLKYRYALGFDIALQLMNPINDFQTLTYGHRKGMDFYASYRTRGPLGFELGYYFTDDKAKNISTVPGTQLFGATATTTTTYQCKFRVENWYIDAYWHYKIKNKYELKLGGGVAFLRGNLAFYNPAGFSDPVGTALLNMYTNTSAVARVNLGVQTLLTKRIGARALFGFQTTSSARAAGLLQGVDSHMWANSYMFSIGLFYTITGYYDDNPGPNGEFIN